MICSSSEAKILLDFLFQGIFPRLLLLALVVLLVFHISVRRSNGQLSWTQKCELTQLFLYLGTFLAIEYAVPVVLGIFFYGNPVFLLLTSGKTIHGLSTVVLGGVLLSIASYASRNNSLRSFSGSAKEKYLRVILWILGFAIYCQLDLIILKLFPRIHFGGVDVNSEMSLLMIFSILLVMPISEEVFFRGYVYVCLRRRIGILSAFLVSTVIFVVLHQGITGWIGIGLFIDGCLLCIAYEKTRTLAVPITSHIFLNSVGLIRISEKGFFLVVTTSWGVFGLILVVSISFFVLLYNRLYRYGCD
jgi:membrane protease YdiL (CAAX protease family)